MDVWTLKLRGLWSYYYWSKTIEFITEVRQKLGSRLNQSKKNWSFARGLPWQQWNNCQMTAKYVNWSSRCWQYFHLGGFCRTWKRESELERSGMNNISIHSFPFPNEHEHESAVRHMISTVISLQKESDCIWKCYFHHFRLPSWVAWMAAITHALPRPRFHEYIGKMWWEQHPMLGVLNVGVIASDGGFISGASASDQNVNGGVTHGWKMR